MLLVGGRRGRRRWRDCVGGDGFELWMRSDLYYMSCCVRCMLSGCTNRCDFYLQLGWPLAVEWCAFRLVFVDSLCEK